MAQFFGNYDWRFLCTPPMPVWEGIVSILLCRGGPQQQPPSFDHDEPIAPFVAIVMGLQHALAMIGGIITVPLLVAGTSNADLGTERTQYLISAGLIISGFTSLIQVSRIKIPYTNIFIGTGLVSVMGTSFTFLPIAVDALEQMRTKSEFLTEDDEFDGEKAYGALIGTLLVCAWVEVVLAFIKPEILRNIFTPIVTGITVFLIGASLVGTGIQFWGGGAFCANNVNSEDPPLCSNNGDVQLLYGSPEYVGLGFSVFSMLVLIEIFGSPFLRSTNVVIALLFGYLVAALSSYQGDSYVNNSKIEAAESITFLWVYTFPLSVYPPLLLPAILGYLVTTAETIGDVTTTEEVSKLPVDGPEHFKRIRGGLLGDGLSSLLAGLGTSMPNTTFSQNNGVIALTRCASRRAGIACAGWLILFGILSKIAAFFTSIPDCVLGGMTTFLFANVAISGIKILASTNINRRDRFILACSMGLGLGVVLVPEWATNNLWNCSDCSEGLRSLRDGIILMLSTGYSMGCGSAIILNLIMPAQSEDNELESLPITEKPSLANKDTTDAATGLAEPAGPAATTAVGDV